MRSAPLYGVALLLACIPPPTLGPEPTFEPITIAPEEAAVYMAAFASVTAPQKRQVLLEQRLVQVLETEGTALQPGAFTPNRSDFALALGDFYRKASFPETFATSPWNPTDVLLLGDSLLLERCKPMCESWQHVHEAYPGSGPVVAVSRVGFSPDSTRAILWLATHCAPVLCGGGDFLLMQRDSAANWVTIGTEGHVAY
jgi:hypothetical protein